MPVPRTTWQRYKHLSRYRKLMRLVSIVESVGIEETLLSVAKSGYHCELLYYTKLRLGHILSRLKKTSQVNIQEAHIQEAHTYIETVS